MRQSRVISFYMVFRQAEQALLFLRPDEEKHRGKYLCAVFFENGYAFFGIACVRR